MTCEECREWMLEADVDALRADVDSPLTLHLLICSACHARAEALHTAHSRMRTSYQLAAPVGGADAVARLAMASNLDITVPGNDDVVLAFPRRQVWRMIGVGIAAGLALVLMSERGIWHFSAVPENTTEVPEQATPSMAEANISVEVPDGQNAIVMQTSDPKIAVVWIYQ